MHVGREVNMVYQRMLRKAAVNMHIQKTFLFHTFTTNLRAERNGKEKRKFINSSHAGGVRS